MSFSFDNNAILSVLRKYDTQCNQIIDSCNKVKIYNYDKPKNDWVMQDQSEGAFYLVKRILPPQYKFVVLSKYNSKPGSFPMTTDIPISANYIYQSHQQFYMFKNEQAVIQAVMFPTINDCERISKQVDRLLRDLRQQQQCASSSVTVGDRGVSSVSVGREERLYRHNNMSEESGDYKILSLLESARQRYNEGHTTASASATATTRPPPHSAAVNIDRRSRHIDIADLFPANSNINGHRSPPAATATAAAAVVPVVQDYSRQCSVRKEEAAVSASVPSSTIIIPSTVTVVTNSKRHSSCSGSTLTVTELERILSQSTIKEKNTGDSDDSDDSELLDPHKLTKSAHNNNTILPSVTSQPTVLSKEQLKDTLIHLLTSDHEDFLSRLHLAYIDLCHKRTSYTSHK